VYGPHEEEAATNKTEPQSKPQHKLDASEGLGGSPGKAMTLGACRSFVDLCLT